MSDPETFELVGDVLPKFGRSAVLLDEEVLSGRTFKGKEMDDPPSTGVARPIDPTRLEWATWLETEPVDIRGPEHLRHQRGREGRL